MLRVLLYTAMASMDIGLIETQAGHSRSKRLALSSDEGGNNSTLWVCGIKSNILIPIVYVLLYSQ